MIDPPPLSSTGRKPAIAPAQLDAIAHAHLPAVVTNATLASGDSVHILWQVNRQQTGPTQKRLFCVPFYQDRLGTSMGKVENRVVFS